MKLAALLLLAAGMLAAQVSATLKPISIAGAKGAIGDSKVGLWTVSIVNRYAVPVDVPHEVISEAFPALKDFPNQLAEDLLTRSASNSFWSVVARWGPQVLAAAGAAYGIQGIIAGNITHVWIGQGVAMAPMAFNRATARAPAPNVYFSSFCPERISVPAYGAATCFIASGLVRNASTMSAVIQVPGVVDNHPTIGEGTLFHIDYDDHPSPDLAAERLEKILRARGLDDHDILAMVK